MFNIIVLVLWRWVGTYQAPEHKKPSFRVVRWKRHSMIGNERVSTVRLVLYRVSPCGMCGRYLNTLVFQKRQIASHIRVVIYQLHNIYSLLQNFMTVMAV